MRISGALATVLTHPFDTVKSIRQAQLGNPQSQTTDRTIPILRKMFHEQGLRSWYKGTRLLKSIIIPFSLSLSP